MRRYWFVSFMIVPLVLTSFVSAWGYDGHRRINRTAAQSLSGPFGRYLKHYQEALYWYGPVPDYIKSTHKDEFHRHFIDADYYDEFPFNSIPMEYDSLLEKYGEEKIRKWGMAPWAVEESCQLIIQLFQQKRFDEAIYALGVLGHYVADLHMPLHTVANYNGQFTGNEGVHFRWEDRLVKEYIKRIKPVGSLETVTHPVNFSMKIVRESYQVHSALLNADTQARKVLSEEEAEQLDTYEILPFEKPYLDILYKESESVLKDRLGRAVMRIASLWNYCWIEAGSPKLP